MCLWRFSFQAQSDGSIYENAFSSPSSAPLLVFILNELRKATGDAAAEPMDQ